MAQQDGLYDSQGPQVLAIVIIFPVVAIITVMLRLYTRFKIIANAAVDDFCIIIAMVMSVGDSVCVYFQVRYGMGRHIATLTEQEGVDSLKALFASIIIYNFGLLFTKLSILLQYLRVCTSKRVTVACYAVLVVVILNGIETFFAGLFTCVPVAFFWDTTIPDGVCVNKPALWFANAGINILTDFSLLILPIFILQGLLLPIRQRISLSLILALGAFACIASIIRLHALYIVTISEDPSWDDPGTATWSSIELNVAIICTSISTLRPFISRFLPWLSSTTVRSGPAYANTRARRATGSGTRTGKFTSIGVDEVNLREDVEVGSIRKPSTGSTEVGDNAAESDTYVIQGVADSVHILNGPLRT